MGSVPAVLQVGVCVLISLAAVLALLVVWRDDHKWSERDQGARAVEEAGPYPLNLHVSTSSPVAGRHAPL